MVCVTDEHEDARMSTISLSYCTSRPQAKAGYCIIFRVIFKINHYILK